VSRGILPLALVLVLACGGGSEAPSGQLEVREAWVEPPASGRGPAGGFLTLANGSERGYRLTGASSPAAGRIEIHRSWIENGVAHMARVRQLAIPPGETVRLEPGGLHLMIFDAPDLDAAGGVTLRLEFAGGERREVKAAVRPAGGEPRGAGHGHPETGSGAGGGDPPPTR